nr:molybdopterin molybdotransferase MoeA [Actinomycetales bacterium]
MITVEQHLARITDGVRPLPSEEVPIIDGVGRVLAEPLLALHPVPPFTNSAMDGFAVRAAVATPGVWLPVRGDVPAGPVEPAPLEPGTAQRIMTGAPLPEGADAIVPVEDTDQPRGPAPLPERVRIDAAPVAGRFVRRAGEDVAPGAEVLPAGTLLTPAAVAAAISVGHGTARVHRRPRVVVLSTGAELRPAGEPLEPGQIPDSNGPLLAALARGEGAEVLYAASTGDGTEEFAAALHTALAADVVVTSGGASAGAFDVVKEVAEPLGVEFVEVAMQPGKPQGHGWLQPAPDGEVAGAAAGA